MEQILNQHLNDDRKLSKHVAFLSNVASCSPVFTRGRHAAGLLYKGKMVCFGSNKPKSHPMQKEYSRNPDYTHLHAEIDCLVNALRTYDVDFISKCEMIVVRVCKKGNLMYSKPCEGCQKAIERFSIGRVRYT